ncbi:MAG: hypothetical protein KME57_17925 [Scytonema hyalinum WJT4-NPBG1]|nr:hypothetical protein [Scytonema hyalinum WJT4-NPBG1]
MTSSWCEFSLVIAFKLYRKQEGDRLLNQLQNLHRLLNQLQNLPRSDTYGVVLCRVSKSV